MRHFFAELLETPWLGSPLGKMRKILEFKRNIPISLCFSALKMLPDLGKV